MSIQTDIDRAIVLEQEISVRVEELKSIKKRLEAAALKGPHIPLEDADRQGKQYIARGLHHTVPIIISSDELVKSFKRDSPQHARILAALPEPLEGEFSSFFCTSTAFESCFADGKIFRAQAVALLGAQYAPHFITACLSVDKNGIPKNKVIIDLGRAESVP